MSKEDRKNKNKILSNKLRLTGYNLEQRNEYFYLYYYYLINKKEQLKVQELHTGNIKSINKIKEKKFLQFIYFLAPASALAAFKAFLSKAASALVTLPSSLPPD